MSGRNALAWKLKFASYARNLVGEESLQSRWSRKHAILRHARVLALATCMGSLAGVLAACSVSDDAILTASSDISARANVDLPMAETADLADGDAPETAEAGETAPAVEGKGAVETAEAAGDDGAQPAQTDSAAADGLPEPETVAEADALDDAADEERTRALAVVAEEQPGPSPFARLFSRQNDAAVEDGRQTAMQPGGDDPGAPAVTADTDMVEDGDIEIAEADDVEAASDEMAAGDVAPMTTASITGSGASPAAPGQRESILLPGVRGAGALYQFSNRSHFDYNSYDNDNGSVQVASAAGMAALAGRRLQVQHAGVNVACLKPRLVQILRQIESRFGRPVIITSGFRDRQHNRRVGGARESKHMSCEAADIQVKGVSKGQIAEFVRALPGRGGVGTYCHTESVHVDIGSKRDWNWRCRRRS